MNLREKATKGVFWSAIQNWGMEGISFLTFIALSRLLAPEDFGLVAIALSFTIFIRIFMDQGFSAAIVQRANLEREHLDTAFWSSLLMGVLLTAVTISLSGFVASFYNEKQLSPVLIWLSCSFILGALSSTQTAILKRNFNFKSLAIRSLAATMAGGIVGVSMALTGFGVWSLVAQNIVISLTGVIVLWRASAWRPRFNFSIKHFKELFSFGISIVGTKILNFFNHRSDVFLIGYFLGPTTLGYYTIGYRLVLVMIRILTGITNIVAAPTFSRLQHNPVRMRRALYKVTQYTSLLVFPIFLGLAVLAPEVVLTLFGEKWAPSVPVLQILTLIGILQSVLVFNASVLKASGKPSWQLGIMFLTSICSVIGLLLVVRWGIVAIATSYVVVGYILAPISYIVVRRLIQIDIISYLKHFVAPVSASIIMILAILGLKYVLKYQELNLYLQLSIYLTVGATIYLLLIIIVARSISEQVLELISLAIPRWKIRKIYTHSSK